ncbi:hypothetical protein [Actinomadura sp. 3N407]|uniref:hypothetical protein n=1 Tax=Actinomadura sp. 3N407 TaxID=3457423 RepID=UPI003FCCAE5E
MKKLLVIPAAVALTLGMSACGSDSKDDAGGGSSPSATASTSVNPSGGTITGNGGGGNGGGGDGGNGNGGGGLTAAQKKSIAKVIDCMRKKGYDMPEPSPTSPAVAPRNVEGMDPAKVNKDSQECAAQATP